MQHPGELPTILGQIDGLGGGPQNGHTGGLQVRRQLQRGLSTQLHEHAHQAAAAAFRLNDLHDVFERERLEVQARGDVVVGGDGLRVAVDHDGLVPGRSQHHGGVHARVVEFNALTDPVGARTENHDRRIRVRGDLVLVVVAGVVVGREGLELGRTRVNGLEHGADVQGVADTTHHGLVQVHQFTDLGVREAVAFGLTQRLGAQVTVLADQLSGFIEQLQLVQEPRVDRGGVKELLERGTGQQGPLHVAQPLRGGFLGALHQAGHGVGPGRHRGFGEVEGRALLLQGPQRLLQGLCEVTADGHGLTHRLHGGGQRGIRGRELLERETRNLDHHVVQGRFETRRGLPRDVVGDLVQGVPQ